MNETESWARGDWMQTFTGARFYPMDPRPEDIDHRDIAHALSLLCRYGGHLDRFYSVAEHCILMSLWAERELPTIGLTESWRPVALAALLHDATEAYVVDVPRPLKRYLPDYRTMEATVWKAICAKFDISLDLPPIVKEADTRILLTERDALMSQTRYSWSQDGMTPLPVEIQEWSPWAAEAAYLQRLAELTGA